LTTEKDKYQKLLKVRLVVYSMLKEIFRGTHLYFPGCFTEANLSNIKQNYEKILKKIGIDFKHHVMKCCGAPFNALGYKEESENLVDDNNASLKKKVYPRLLVNDPTCYKTFKEKYSVDVEHLSTFILKKMDLKKTFKEDITYHDPCDLGRHSKIFNEPRKILENLGFNVVEFPENKENAQCCGACGFFSYNYPKIGDKIANQLLKQLKTKKLITTSPHCYYHLRKNAPTGVQVLELSEVLV